MCRNWDGLMVHILLVLSLRPSCRSTPRCVVSLAFRRTLVSRSRNNFSAFMSHLTLPLALPWCHPFQHPICDLAQLVEFEDVHWAGNLPTYCKAWLQVAISLQRAVRSMSVQSILDILAAIFLCVMLATS